MTAVEIAAEMVRHAAQRRRKRTMSFSIKDNGQPLPFITHWKDKNCCGVTFKKSETAAAQAWLEDALLADYEICSHWGSRYWGGGIYSLAIDQVQP